MRSLKSLKHTKRTDGIAIHLLQVARYLEVSLYVVPEENAASGPVRCSRQKTVDIKRRVRVVKLAREPLILERHASDRQAKRIKRVVDRANRDARSCQSAFASLSWRRIHGTGVNPRGEKPMDRAKGARESADRA